MTDLFNTGIRPAVDAYLQKKSEEVRNYGDYWSASSAGYCMRLNIMRRLGVPPVPEIADSAARTRVFEAGHIFHEWMQRITKNAGLSIAQEVELQNEELMVRGHFDDLVLISEPASDVPDDAPSHQIPYDGKQHLILYDYKTAHSASFNYSKNRPMGNYHTMQLATYMYMLNNKQQELLNSITNMKMEALKYKIPVGEIDPAWTGPVTEARILSISKDDLRMHETQLMWSPELEKRVYEYWSTLNGYWKAKTMPRCTCAENDGGFMARRSSKGKVYNDYFYNDEPCSLEWYQLWKEKQGAESK